jgi:hypothetical protein
LPFSLLALKDRRYLGAFRPLAVAGHVSLFPLLFTAMEFPIKVIYTIVWLTVVLLAFDRLTPAYVIFLFSHSMALCQTNFEQVATTKDIPFRSLLAALHRSSDPIDRLLVAWPSVAIWRKAGISTVDVHQFLLRDRRRRELVGILRSVPDFIGNAKLFMLCFTSVLTICESDFTEHRHGKGDATATLSLHVLPCTQSIGHARKSPFCRFISAIKLHVLHGIGNWRCRGVEVLVSCLRSSGVLGQIRDHRGMNFILHTTVCS